MIVVFKRGDCDVDVTLKAYGDTDLIFMGDISIRWELPGRNHITIVCIYRYIIFMCSSDCDVDARYVMTLTFMAPLFR